MRLTALTLTAEIAIALAVGGCEGGGAPLASETVPQPSREELEAAGLADFPFAPEDRRIDVDAPSFSNPTEITNPLNPISEIPSAVVLGEVDGEPLRIEITLLPETRLIEWNGQTVETRVSQFVAYRGGNMREVALDLYAQADDGDVWYFGEDVFNYADDGHIADMDGAWLVGRDGPPGMITPAEPRVGDAYRSENIPGLVFEESTVKATDVTVDGPRGPVEGAFVIDEHHPDGPEIKKWAPGYGEFFTRDRRDVELMALAVPTDALAGPTPPELARISAGAAEIYDARGRIDWRAAASTVDGLTADWSGFRSADVPTMLAAQMRDALDALERAVGARKAVQSRRAAAQVAVASLDLQLRHRPSATIDLARLDLQAALLSVDAAAGDLPAVRSDVANLDWIRDRIAHAIDAVDLRRIDTEIVELTGATADRDLDAVRETTARLRATLTRARR